MNKFKFTAVLAAAVVTSFAHAETPGSQAAADCFFAMSNSALMEVWPGVAAEKVGRFIHTSRSTHFYTRDFNEISTACNSAEWHLTTLPDGTPFNFRASPVPFAGGTPVHRFQHKAIGSHFYTANQAEYMSVLTNGSATWTYEGIAFYVPVVELKYSTQIDPATGLTYQATNLPTTCKPRGLGNTNKQPAVCVLSFPSPSTGMTPVYRFNSPTRGHYYTADFSEADQMVLNKATNTYTYEGIGFWAFSARPPITVDLPAEITGQYYRLR